MNLPPWSGPVLLAVADWWPLVSQLALLGFTALFVACVGFVAGYLGGEG